MPNIFRANIDKAINKALGPLVFDLTLVKETAGSRKTDVTAGNNLTESTYTVKGWVDEYSQSQVDGTIILSGDRKIVILGGSLTSGIVPESGDSVVAEGQSWQIVSVPKRDPAGATYECHTR